MRKHKTIKLLIRTNKKNVGFADIDKGIVPVILWLQVFPSVVTYYCCEGIHSPNPTDRPYVMFSSKLKDLDEILRTLGCLVTCEVSVNVQPAEVGAPRYYVIRFHSKRCLKYFIKKISCVNQS